MAARVQREDFDVGAEIAAMTAGETGIGAVASFIGLVRDEGAPGRVTALTLEHYPGMTERKLAEVEAEARRRWPLEAVRIIHRYGRLEPGERIVFVAAASQHRAAAFEACAFLIDWLKTQAPFWKLEDGHDGSHWVTAHQADQSRALAWQAEGGADGHGADGGEANDHGAEDEKGREPDG